MEEEWGCAITCSFLKCLCFVTRFIFFYIFFFFRQRVSGKLGKVLSELVSAQKKFNRDAEEDEWRLFCPKVNSETVLAL